MADTKISNLPAVVTPVGTDEFAVNQSGTTKKVTLTQVRSSVPTTSLTGTLNDATVAESNVTQHEAAIDHDALLNFVANEHINHGTTSITAGDGLTGGGDLTTTRTIDVDINGTTDLVAPATNDEILISDLSATNAIRKADVASVVNLADHDQLTNFVANEHVDHSSVSLSAGAGIAAGGLGDLTASRTIAVDGVLEDLDTLGAPSSDGELIVATGAGAFQYEDAGGATFRASLATGTPSSSTFLRGDGTWAVAGGGDVSSSGTPVNNQLAVWTDASTIEGDAGLTWDGTNLTTTGSIFIQEKAEAAADVAGYGQLWVDLASPNTLYFTDDAGTDQRLAYAGGTFHDGFDDFVANEHIDHTSVTLTAGAGLTGGGTIAANRTFNVGAGTGITVNADDVAITAGGVDTTQLADEGVTNAKLAHAAAWTFKIRNAGTTGDPSDAAAADITEELTPATGDFAIGFDASNQIRKYDIGNMAINIVNDTTPQLGGNLDVNGNAIAEDSQELLTFFNTASAVNHFILYNNSTGNAPSLRAVGDDTNIGLDILAKGTGDISLGNYTFDGDQTVGAGQDNYVLTYDNGAGIISLEAATGGGNVSNTGTPVDDQIAVWTSATTVEGTSGLTKSATQFVAGNYTFNTDQSVNGSTDGYILTYNDGAGEISLAANTGASADYTAISVRKSTAGTIAQGQPVYLVGYNVSGYYTVEEADAADPAKMPALGIAGGSITNAATSTLRIQGTLDGMDTSSFSVGDGLYVASGGGLTATRPTAANHLVQKLGICSRSNVSSGIILVLGAGRTNDIPNESDDAIFRISDTTDNTKLLRMDVVDITTGTERTATWQDVSGTVYVTGGTDVAIVDGGTGASTAGGARTNLGLAIGTNVQAWDAQLDDIAALAVTDGNFIVGNGANWVAESGATARTSLGLGSLATQSTIDNGDWSGTDLSVANGGTGASTHGSGNVLVGAGTSAITSTKAAPTGAFVGTTDTQTLTNKTLGATTLSGTLSGAGEVINGNLATVESDSGTLTSSQSGRVIVTTGNITIPTTTGFNCTLISGGAHTVTFNSTTSAAMASGDVMSVIVQSGTVIHAILVASGDKVSFS